MEGFRFPCDMYSHGEKARTKEVFRTAFHTQCPLDDKDLELIIISNTNAEQHFLYLKVSHRCISVYFFQHQNCLVVYAIN